MRFEDTGLPLIVDIPPQNIAAPPQAAERESEASKSPKKGALHPFSAASDDRERRKLLLAKVSFAPELPPIPIGQMEKSKNIKKPGR